VSSAEAGEPMQLDTLLNLLAALDVEILLRDRTKSDALSGAGSHPLPSEKEGEAPRAAPSVGLGRRRSKTRAKLLAAARDVFFELGYAATTVADIVARAGIGRATFYLYFVSKQDVYRAIADDFGDDLAHRLARLDAVLASGARDALRAWLGEQVTWAVTSSQIYRVWSETQSLDPELTVDVWRSTVGGWLDAMPWFRARWPDREAAFTRLAMFIGQIQFFHHNVLTEHERSIATDLLTAIWHAELRAPRTDP
jgi:AcrR family transcriptional regulator